MLLYRAFILGLVQGVTEFLPISSSGHLIIFSRFLGWGAGSLIFDTMLHFGTGLALVVYFWKDLVQAFQNIRSLGLKVLVGTLPAIFAGSLLEDWFESTFRSLEFVSIFLLLGSLLILIAEYILRRRSESKELTLKGSFMVGLFQVLALFPGFSRSGATISGGLILGLNRTEAARFSFLLSIPIVLGAGCYQLAKLLFGVGGLEATAFFWKEALIGISTSFIAGILCINFLMGFLKKNSLLPFVLYRVALVVFLIVVL